MRTRGVYGLMLCLSLGVRGRVGWTRWVADGNSWEIWRPGINGGNWSGGGGAVLLTDLIVLLELQLMLLGRTLLG